MATIENNILTLDSGKQVTLEAIEDLFFGENLNRKVLLREVVNGSSIITQLSPETPLDSIKDLIFPSSSGPDLEYYRQFKGGI